MLLNEKKEQSILTTLQTTIDTTTSDIITQSTPFCYKTLQYQNEIYSTGRNPVSLVVGDFNQDSHVDLAVTNAGSDSISIFLGNGNGTFQKQRIYSTGNESHPQKIAVRDLNDYGLFDLGKRKDFPFVDKSHRFSIFSLFQLSH